MTNSRTLSVLTAAVLLGSAACATGSSDFPGGRQGVLRIEVANDNFLDANVYAFRDGAPDRLGTVTGKTQQTFEVPWSPNQVLVVRVQFIAGGTCETRPLVVEPGQTYTVQLQPDIRTNLECLPTGGVTD